jgi:hypothetical protein
MEIKIPGIEQRAINIEVVPSEEFIAEVIPYKTVHFISRSGLAQPVRKLPNYLANRIKGTENENDPTAHRKMFRALNKGELATSRFVLALHTAFAEHIPFTLSPEVIMGIISQEVAQFVKDYSNDLSVSSLFTNNPEQKEKLVVEVDDFVYGSQNNDWLRGISVFRNLLSKQVPSNILEVMTPKLSQGTIETEVAHLVSFMDAASKYYSYGMSTCCGIPKFRIEGTADDWNTLINSVNQMKQFLPKLESYFNNLLPVLIQIRNTVDGNSIDKSFWTSIYKQDNESGGPYSNGWFNNLYAHLYSFDYSTKQPMVKLKDDKRLYHGPKLNEFPSNLSVVPFEWNYYGNRIPMSFVGGVTSVEYKDGFLKPCLGVAVLERNPE